MRARNAKTAREALRIGKTNTKRMSAIVCAAPKTSKNRPHSLLKHTSRQCRLHTLALTKSPSTPSSRPAPGAPIQSVPLRFFLRLVVTSARTSRSPSPSSSSASTSSASSSPSYVCIMMFCFSHHGISNVCTISPNKGGTTGVGFLLAFYRITFAIRYFPVSSPRYLGT